MGGKRFAVLLCAEDSEYVKKKYGGYFGVFVRMLGEEGETWDMYRVANDEFPDDEEIAEFDGFVITGSCNDAHANDVWIIKLLNLLKKLDSMKKKVLGICFGHQILVRALGGKTGRAAAGWDIGLTTINLSPSKLFTSLKMPTSLSVIECHRDEVWELPPKAEVLAWSKRTGVEMFRYDDHIMGIQGHPEYTKDILLHLIDRLLLRNLIEESFAAQAKSKLEDSEPDREVWEKLFVNFLKVSAPYIRSAYKNRMSPPLNIGGSLNMEGLRSDACYFSIKETACESFSNSFSTTVESSDKTTKQQFEHKVH